VALSSGKVLITGATGGLGQAIARRFAGRGARLILTGRRADVLEQLAAEVGGETIACDLSDRRQLESLAQEAEVAALDVFVANAAVPATGVLTELTLEQVDKMLEVNLRAPVALAHTLVPGMIERGRGHLVFISSLSGKSAGPASSMYSATKFGLRGFALSMREDLRAQGIGVSTVLPGFISDAGLFADADVRLPPGVGTRTPEQVADAVIRAVEHNRAEVEVAPVLLRLGATVAGVAPGPAAAVARLMGSRRIATELSEGQRDKRP
jgi:uncharacterized protein